MDLAVVVVGDILVPLGVMYQPASFVRDKQRTGGAKMLQPLNRRPA
jgi:hypothetical protein